MASRDSIDDQLFLARLRQEVADHYDELDHYYREIWGEHVHHGLWERGDETRSTRPSSISIRMSPDAERSQQASASAMWDVDTEAPPEFSRLNLAQLSRRSPFLQPNTATPSPERGDARSPEYLLGDWASNELPSGVFDTVISIESSEHMQDKPMFFAQARRVLKTGGQHGSLRLACGRESNQRASASPS